MGAEEEGEEGGKECRGDCEEEVRDFGTIGKEGRRHEVEIGRERCIEEGREEFIVFAA